MITFDHALQFDRDGFVLINNLLSPKEVAILISQITESGKVKKHAMDMANMENGASR